MSTSNFLKDRVARTKWSKIIKESLLIIFSILFALVINEWRAGAKLRAEKAKMIDSIILELENNLESLKFVMPYHKKASESLEALIQMKNVKDSIADRTAIDLFFEYSGNGFKEPRVQANAWKTAQLSDAISQFDNETIYRLSVLYELQEEGVEAGWKKTVDSFYDGDSFDKSKNLAILNRFQLALSSLHGMERYLVEKHEETLEYLKAK